MLDQLQRIQEHAVWGPALALLATDGWCADQKVYTQLDGYIKSIAAEGMLENARLQQLGNIFCWKSGLLPWEAKLKSGPATGCEVSASPCHPLLGPALCLLLSGQGFLRIQ